MATDYYTVIGNVDENGLPRMGLALTWNRDENPASRELFIPIRMTCGDSITPFIPQFCGQVADFLRSHPEMTVNLGSISRTSQDGLAALNALRGEFADRVQF